MAPGWKIRATAAALLAAVATVASACNFLGSGPRLSLLVSTTTGDISSDRQLFLKATVNAELVEAQFSFNSSCLRADNSHSLAFSLVDTSFASLQFSSLDKVSVEINSSADFGLGVLSVSWTDFTSSNYLFLANSSHPAFVNGSIGIFLAKFNSFGSSNSVCWSLRTYSSSCICLSNYAPSGIEVIGSCESCEVGRFTNQTGADICISCTPGSFFNSSDVSPCSPCHFGTYANTAVTSCELCEAGKFSNQTGSLSCEECSAGRFSLQGQGSCTVCPTGKYSSNGSYTCEDCDEGTYSNVAQATSFTTCLNCSIGKYSDSKGQTLCTDCVPGKYGTTIKGKSESVCSVCPSGKFSFSQGSSECEVCIGGKFSSEGSSFCETCIPGRYSDDNSTSCSICQPGFFSPSNSTSCQTCDPGKFSLEGASSCSPCPIGFIAPFNGSSSCLACPEGKFFLFNTFCAPCDAGKFSNEQASLDCNDCPVGSFQNQTGASTCRDCPPGSASVESGAAVLSDCSPCQPGFYSEGGTPCIKCPGASYSSDTGSSGCTPCPLYSETLAEGATSVQQCVCSKSFWGKADDFVEGCKICPTVGVDCPVNSSIPKVLDGYFRDPDEVDKVFECVPLSACLRTDLDIETTCAPGYTGAICSECIQGEYFRKGFNCIKCPSVTGLTLTVIALFVLLVFVLYRLIKTGLKVPADVRIAIQWIQVLALFPDLSDAWPVSLNLVFHIASFSNLNLELFSPECAAPISFWDKSFTKLLFPIVITAAFVCAMGILKIFGKLSHSIQKIQSNIMSLLIFFMSVFYTMLISTALSVFNCKFNGSKFVLVFDPKVECFESDSWKTNATLMSFFFALYGFGYPSFLCFFFWRYRKDPNDPEFSHRFDYVIKHYQRKYFYWELVELLKKSTFVLLSDFLVYNATHFTKIFVVVSFLFTAHSVDIVIRPLRSNALNRLSFLWNLTCIVVLLSDGLIFSLNEVEQDEKKVFAVFMIILIAVSLIFSTCTLILKFSAWLKKRKEFQQEYIQQETKATNLPATISQEEGNSHHPITRIVYENE